MPISQDGIDAFIVEHLGAEAVTAIREAQRRSKEIIQNSRAILAENMHALEDEFFGEGVPVPVLTWVAVGSVGRLEATEESDLDLILLYDLPPNADEEDVGTRISGLDQAARVRLREKLTGVTGVSHGQELTGPTTIKSLRDSAGVGGRKDTVEKLTKRTLILSESRTIYPNSETDLRLNARQAIMEAFQASSVTRGRHLLSLVNDIVRYYRTLCVDYKSRVDAEGKPWGIRNIKLRHGKKLWFVSTALAIISATADRESHPDEEEERCQELLDLSPVHRLAYALQVSGLAAHLSLLRIYDQFLLRIGDATARAELEKIEHSERYTSEVFRELKTNSDHLHERFLDVFADLPSHWRSQLLSHFLL